MENKYPIEFIQHITGDSIQSIEKAYENFLIIANNPDPEFPHFWQTKNNNDANTD